MRRASGGGEKWRLGGGAAEDVNWAKAANVNKRMKSWPASNGADLKIRGPA